MSFESQTVSVRNGMFQVEMRRAGKGDPLVFLHGAGGQAEWDPYFDMLAERSTVYVPSHPGWAGSTGIEHIDGVEDMAVFYLDLFDALGLSSVNLMGSSLGGMFAAEIAARDHAYVRKLVLCNPVGIWLDEAPVLDFFTVPMDELMKALYYTPPELPPPPTDPKAAATMLIERAKAMGSTGKFLWPIPDRGLKKRIHRIKAPTLIVWGEGDGLISAAYGPEFQKRIPGSKLVVIPKAAHLPMVEQPEAFVGAVTAFLEA
jgi:pimeloyl-ACP methyl ester carboxylesterase